MTTLHPRFDHPSYIVRQGIVIEEEPPSEGLWVKPSSQTMEDPHRRQPHSAAIFHLAVPYARGKGADVGCGVSACLPHMISVDCGDEGRQVTAEKVMKAPAFAAIADRSLDFVFSSYLLQRIERERARDVLKAWSQKLKDGGHLILHLPQSDNDSKTGAKDAKTDQRWKIQRGSVEKLLRGSGFGCGWVQVEDEERSDGDGSALFEVYRKVSGGFSKRPWVRNPDGKKRCLVARWGAIGDYLVAASVMKGLKEQGYHITVNTNSLGEQVLRNNPYIDAFLIIESHMMDREQYAEYFGRIGERYDKVVDLDDSLEGLMVAQEHQKPFCYPTRARQFIYDKNYQELAHHIAGVPSVIEDSFFPTAAEDDWGAGGRAFMAQAEPCVVWAINGSAIYKIYPWVNVVAEWLAREKVHVIFTGGPDVSFTLQQGILKTMEEDGADTAYIHPCVGQWSIRESFVIARHADCVVGPDTGIMHAVGMIPVPKVVFLSCSSAENLTKHWINTTALAPDSDRCPCFPCHQNHRWWHSCTKDEEHQVARCASSIAPEVVFDAIMAAIKGPR